MNKELEEVYKRVGFKPATILSKFNDSLTDEELCEELKILRADGCNASLKRNGYVPHSKRVYERFEAYFKVIHYNMLKRLSEPGVMEALYEELGGEEEYNRVVTAIEEFRNNPDKFNDTITEIINIAPSTELLHEKDVMHKTVKEYIIKVGTDSEVAGVLDYIPELAMMLTKPMDLLRPVIGVQFFFYGYYIQARQEFLFLADPDVDAMYVSHKEVAVNALLEYELSNFLEAKLALLILTKECLYNNVWVGAGVEPFTEEQLGRVTSTMLRSQCLADKCANTDVEVLAYGITVTVLVQLLLGVHHTNAYKFHSVINNYNESLKGFKPIFDW